jgi:hypothetical protein
MHGHRPEARSAAGPYGPQGLCNIILEGGTWAAILLMEWEYATSHRSTPRQRRTLKAASEKTPATGVMASGSAAGSSSRGASRLASCGLGQVQLEC